MTVEKINLANMRIGDSEKLELIMLGNKLDCIVTRIGEHEIAIKPVLFQNDEEMRNEAIQSALEVVCKA
jgi:uncharacterized protein (DUF1499 family)